MKADNKKIGESAVNHLEIPFNGVTNVLTHFAKNDTGVCVDGFIEVYSGTAMLVFLPAEGGGRGESRLVRHVRFERAEGVVSDAHRSADAGHGTVFVDAVNSEGALEVPAGARVLIGAGPSMLVRSCRRCCVVRGQVHHWELEVG